MFAGVAVASQAPAPARRGRRPGRRRGLVDRDRVALAGGVAPLHRRLAAQLDPRADPRLQRLRPPRRLGDRVRRRGRCGTDAADSGARPGCCGCSTPRSAARSPGCSRRPWSSGSVPLLFARGTAPAPGRPDALAGLARRHRADLQPDGRDLPPVLHGGARPGDRCPGRHRLDGPLASPRRRWSRPAILGFTTAMTTALAFELLARDGVLAPLAASTSSRSPASRPRRLIVGVRHLPRRLAATVAVVALLAGLTGPAAYSLVDRRDPAHRLDPERRPGHDRWLRRCARRWLRSRPLRRDTSDRRPRPRTAPEQAPGARQAPAACSTAARRAVP